MAASPTTSDPLLDELNGALAKTGEPTAVEAPPAQAPGLSEQLETRAPAPTGIIRAAQVDKTHSKAAGGHGYRVWVRGTYYAKSIETKGNLVKDYCLPFNLPHLVNAKGESALGIIVGASKPNGGLLKNALLKHDPMAVTYRTHAIEKVEPLNGAPEPTNLQHFSFEALKKYARENLVPDGFPLDPDSAYWNVEHLREDVIDFKVNATGDVLVDPGLITEQRVKGGFGLKKTPIDRIRERHAIRIEERELAQMNPGIEE